MLLSALSLKLKIGLGLLLSYTLFEVYMQLRTQYIIYSRLQVFEQLLHELEDGDKDDLVVAKFKSLTVCGMFVNPFEEYRPQTGFEFLFVRVMEVVESIYGSQLEVHKKRPNPDGELCDIEHILKVHRPNFELLKRNSVILQECIGRSDFRKWSVASKSLPAIRDQMLFSWFGQLCLLVQIGGINFLTDPIISDHLINQTVGPKRLIKTPISVPELRQATNNKLNFVLVSHDHPDHLELDFAKQIGNSSTWIVPLGLRKKLARKGIYNIIEMDWWDRVPLNDFITRGLDQPVDLPDKYEVVCVPAMHWLGRYVLDSNQSLWASFIVLRNGKSVLYHAGDTGYVKELFEVIGKKYGPMTMSLLPIGQYCPSWHQKPRHTSPAEALEIIEHTSSKHMMGIHWGTFKLSSEPILEPRNVLFELAKGLGKTGEYKTPEFGITYVYDMHREVEVENGYEG